MSEFDFMAADVIAEDRVVDIRFADSVNPNAIEAAIMAYQKNTLSGQRLAGNVEALGVGYTFGPDVKEIGIDDLTPQRDRFVSVVVPKGSDIDEIVRIIEIDLLQRNLPAKVAVRPDFLPPSELPADPLLGTSDISGADTQWSLFRCGIVSAWEVTKGRGAVVADIDWGFRLTHQDLAVGWRHDVQSRSEDVSSGGNVGHGTGSAGLIGAAENAAGIVGFAPECELWLIRGDVIRDGRPRNAAIPMNPWVAAIDRVVEKARAEKRRVVVNLQLQTGDYGPADEDIGIHGAIERATNADVVVCLPAGNGARSADYDRRTKAIPPSGAIVIAATIDHRGTNYRERSSNWGERVDVCAPGDPDDDYTCGGDADDHYTRQYGRTSGASAKVAGAVALLLAANPQLKVEDIRTILRSTGQPVETEPGRPVGGLLSSDQTLRAAGPPADQPPSWPCRCCGGTGMVTEYPGAVRGHTLS